jgi:N-acetylglucosaminyl-diphospho-decaprenol L-rhamnosyltransferase
VAPVSRQYLWAVLVAVVVTYSATRRDLGRCIGALRSGGGVDRIVLIDTGGSAIVDDLPGNPPCEVIRVANRGYGAAANVGFARAAALGADRVALLNDDVVVRPGWTTPLLAALDEAPEVGAAQPKLIESGTGTVNSLGVRVGPDGAGVDVGDGQPDQPVGEGAGSRRIELFTGGAVMFTTGFLADTGGFDERYFLYYEDVDLGRRGAAQGWEYRLAPAAVVEHARGASTSGDAGRTRYLQERNRLWAAFRFADPATLSRALWLSIRRLRHEPKDVHAKALAAGLAGAPQRVRERIRAR